MAKYKCDNEECEQIVDVGVSNPSLVLCKKCNEGEDAWNCLDKGNHSCECIFCERHPWSEQDSLDSVPF